MLIVLGLILLLIINGYIPREKLYYVPKMSMYLKIIYYPKDDFGYVLFGKDRNLKICSMVDYIAVYKETCDRSVIIFIDPLKKNELHVFSEYRKIYKKNPVHYKFLIHKNTAGSIMEFYKTANSNKSPYFYIEISDDCGSVSISNGGDTFSKELKPIYTSTLLKLFGHTKSYGKFS